MNIAEIPEEFDPTVSWANGATTTVPALFVHTNELGPVVAMGLAHARSVILAPLPGTVRSIWLMPPETLNMSSSSPFAVNEGLNARSTEFVTVS